MFSLATLTPSLIQAQVSQARKIEVARPNDGSLDTVYPQSEDLGNSSTATAPKTMIANGTAPGLSSIFINNVCSATAGCETISRGQLLTSLVHGGSYVDVYVWEIGYGYGEVAKQGGALLSNSYLVDYRGVCAASGGGYTVNCPAGAAYVGWRYVWNVDYYIIQNHYGNLFTAQDTSQSYPNGTYSTSISIQHN